VREAAEVADDGLLVTIGIEPTYAGTGFGYVRGGAALAGHATAQSVSEFVEKPDGPTARAYLESGEYRWNGGIFVVRASTLLDLLAEHHPDLAAGLRTIAAEPDSMVERWPGLTRIAIDYAVAEPAAAAGRVAMVPGPFGWEDLGDFASLASLLPGDPAGLKVLGDESLVVSGGSSGLVVPAAGRTVAVVGLEDVVVVDTGDALLVTTYAHAQEVKAVPEVLDRQGRRDLT
jgi:mannose-1-phosphate guanylyltransferase